MMKSTTVILAALVAVSILSAQLAQAQSATAEQRSQKRLLDCTLESEDLDDCDAVGYATRVAVFSLPGLIIAMCLFLVCPWYCCCKYCCNLCGGRHQSPNFCCPNTTLPARYSKGDIVRPKVLLIICLAMTVAALIWSMVGTASLIGGLTDFAESIINVPSVLTTEITAIDDALVLELFDTSTNLTSTDRLFDSTGANLKQEAESARDDLEKSIKDSLGNYQEQLDNAKNVLWAIFLIPCCLVFLGFLFGCCNCRKYIPMTIVWFLFLFGFIIWIAHFGFSLLSMVVGDVCAEISGLANKQLNLVSILAQCDDAQFSGFKTTFRQLEITQAENTCNQIVNLCYINSDDVYTNVAAGRVFTCPSDLSCSGMTFAKLVDLMETGFFINPSIQNNNTADEFVDYSQFRCRDSSASAGPCTIARCADDCYGGDAAGQFVTSDTPSGTKYRLTIGQSSKEIYAGFLGARTISNTIDTLGARYATCDSIMSIIIGPFDPPCQKVVSGLIYDRQASGLLGLACIAGIFIFAWGAKRFIPLSEAEKAQPIDGADAPPEDQVIEG